MMTEISAQDVMALRNETGMGMMECKRALQDAEGDPQRAKELLRERMKGKMAERTERATAEGRIGIAMRGATATIVEVRTETDFAAKNEDFIALVDELAEEALDLPAGEIKPTTKMRERLDDIRLTTKENVNFARGQKFEGGAFGSYLHHDAKRGAVIQVEGDVDEETLKGVCQHIVAHVPPPIAVDESGVPKNVLDKIREDAVREARESGKNQEIAQKIAEGRVRKYLEEQTLLNQKYVRDDSKTIRKVLPKNVKVRTFVRYTVGQD